MLFPTVAQFVPATRQDTSPPSLLAAVMALRVMGVNLSLLCSATTKVLWNLWIKPVCWRTHQSQFKLHISRKNTGISVHTSRISKNQFIFKWTMKFRMPWNTQSLYWHIAEPWKCVFCTSLRQIVKSNSYILYLDLIIKCGKMHVNIWISGKQPLEKLYPAVSKQNRIIPDPSENTVR